MVKGNKKIRKVLKSRKKFLMFLIFLCFLGFLSWKMFFSSYAGAVTAKIYQGGTLLYTIPLDKVQEDYEIIISGENGEENTILVSYKEISVSHANCPDQVCVKRGTVFYSQVPIVCMPNQLVIEFEKEGENIEVDTEIGYTK